VFRKRTKKERFWEILPGLQVWTVFIGAIALAYYKPLWAAVFIVCFDLYWVLKAINVASHLISAYRKFQVFVKLDWMDYLEKLKDLKAYKIFLEGQLLNKNPWVLKRWLKEEQKRVVETMKSKGSSLNYSEYFHLLILPFVDESFEVLDSTFSALAKANYPKEKMMVVLGGEERAGEAAKKIALQIQAKYTAMFYKFFITAHPDGLAGEIKGKSANASYTIRQILPELENLNIKVKQVLVSNFDSDTIVHPQYFARVMYEFLLCEKPYQASYQPIAIYNNNIWDSPSFIRVVSVGNSFWQFTESSRADRLRTFSSHTMTLKALLDVDFWKKDIVNEDGYIYWQCYLRYNGDYRTIPLFIPISLDTCLAETNWQTLKNQYKQRRRWAYNVEYWPHLVPKLITVKAPFWNKMYKLFQYWEQNITWATTSILISSLGWLPLIFSHDAFRQSVVGYNLPMATKTLMGIATFFLIFSVYISLILLPPRPKKYSRWRSVTMYLQWFLVPLTSVLFGSLPSVEAHTRLMFGKYLEFWVTPKSRKGENTALTMKEMQTVKN